MLIVETIAKIRRLFRNEHRSIREISRELRLSRKVVRKALRSDATAFAYKRQRQPRPQLDSHVAQLETLLAAELARPKRERLSYVRLFETLREEGYAGGYDSVRRYAQRWFRDRAASAQGAFVPLAFAPGEAFQFDWSHEVALIDGMPAKIKVAHVRPCHSRLFLLRAYPRETQEMVFDAHEQAFRFFGGSCRRGIYDNMRTAVAAVSAGRQRAFNRRFQQFCSHHLVEPTACTPRAAWEKGQVENQVRTARNRFFKPVPRFGTLAGLNAWLEERCLAWARTAAHPVQRDRTVMAVYEAEDRPALVGPRARPSTASTRWRPPPRPPASCASTTTATRSPRARPAGACSCGPTPSGSPSSSTASASPSTPAASAGTRPSTTPGTTCPCSRASPGRSGTASRSAPGTCRTPWARSGGAWPRTPTATGSSSPSSRPCPRPACRRWRAPARRPSPPA